MDLTQKSISSRFRDQGEISFLIHDIDDATSPRYYGWVHASGAFMIVREVDFQTTRYYEGDGVEVSYEVAWAVRATHSYDYIYNLGLF